MATYRQRVVAGSLRSNTCSNIATDLQSGVEYPTVSNVANNSSGVVTSGSGFPTSETIYDYVTDPGEKRSFHNCYHARHNWARLWSERAFAYPSPTHSMRLSQVTYARIGGSLPTLFSEPDWSSFCNNLASKLNGSLSCGSLALVSLAEAKKTAAMIKNPFNLLRRNWRKTAKGLTPAALAKESSNIWLESNYGWNAFRMDLKTSQKTMSKIRESISQPDSEDFESTRLGAGNLQTSGVGSWQYNAGQAWSNLNDQNTIGTVWWSDSSLRGRLAGAFRRDTIGCYQTIDIAERWSRTYAFLDAWGLTLPRFVDTVWELVPFSFVIDWFVDPLGLWNAPGTVQRLCKADVKDLCKSTKIYVSYEIEANLPYSYYYGGYWAYKPFNYRSPGVLARGTSTYRYYLRNLLSTSSLWSMYLASLADADLSLTQGVSGAALAIQRLLR